MAQHCKIKCKNEYEYEKIKDILGILAIEYYQKAPNKALHITDIISEKELKKALKKYGLKNFKIKEELPDFDKAMEDGKKLQEKEGRRKGNECERN